MKYGDFVTAIRHTFEQVARSNGVEGDIVIREIVKNNNVRLKAISVVSRADNATPTIYLESYYEAFLEGAKLEEIAQEILELYQSHSDNIDIRMEDFVRYSFVKDRIAYKVVNYEMNKENLRHIPHLKILDLAIIFHVIIEEGMYNSATAMIHKTHLEMWGIGQKELEQIAFYNTPRLMPPLIKKIEDMVAEMILGEIIGGSGEMNLYDSRMKESETESSKDENSNSVREECVYGGCMKEQLSDYVREEIENMKRDECLEMYVLTNEKRINGAGVIFYDKVLKKFADSIGKDLIIIPSSVHEVILIPSSEEIVKKDIDEMIQEVNLKQLDMVEVLSQHMYLYRRADDRIYM